jgi:tetratricopeptide (TPR) repeat protein
MPRPSALFLILAVSALGAGCSTLQPKAVGEGLYRESSMDVQNRAPSSMSVPQDPAAVSSGTGFHSRTQADYHFALAETYSLQGNALRAIEEYKLTLVYDPAPHVRVRLASEYVKQGLVSEALEQTKAALESDPTHVEGRLLLGGLYSALRMYDDALKEYRQVLEHSPTNLEAPLFIGALLAEQKRYSEAADHFERLAKHPDNPNAHVAWYYLGRVRLEDGKAKNNSKAEAAFQQSLSVKGNYTEAAMAIGQLHESSGRREKALGFYKSFQEKHGPNPIVAEELSRLYIEERDYARAYDQLAIMEAADPSDINIKAKMAFILIEQQRYPDAIVRLEDVLAMEPTSDKIRFYLGAVYEEVKDYKAAIGHFQKVPAISSYYPESVIHTSYLYKLLGDYPKAIDAIKAGIRAKDDHPQFYALYASLLDDQKEYRKAAEMLDSAVSRFPDHAQLHFFLGNMQDRLGLKAETIASMKRVLALDRDHVQALNFLAYTYAESGTQLDEAEKMVRRAIELQPGDGYILDTLGWILFKKGNYPDAIRVLEAAYKIQPNESVIAEHLGDAYYQQQMPEKAKVLYMQAAENESNVTNLEKIRVKITSVDRQIQTLGSEDLNARTPASAKSP